MKPGPPSDACPEARYIRFSYDYVKNHLCEGCRLKVPETVGPFGFHHYLNGEEIRCTANAWRNSPDVHAQKAESINSTTIQ